MPEKKTVTGLVLKPPAKPEAAAPPPQAVCSPAAEKNFKEAGTCFSLEALTRLAEAWNLEHPGNKINVRTARTRTKLWKEIDKRMHDVCSGTDKEACWVANIGDAKKNAKVASSVRPRAPPQWDKKPYTWLSNWDIQKVMKQYEEAKDRFHYKFLGVLPIDFEGKTSFGQCVSDEMCTLSDKIPSLMRNKVQYLGLITNLDKHDEPGSHWTSLFMCIDPKKACFGAYYYDSVSRNPPPEIVQFVDKFEAAINKYLEENGQKDHPKFRRAYSVKRHQYGNSECGVFSMVYQIRWLEMLEKKQGALFEDIIDVKLTDAQMNKYYRRLLFVRP